MQQMTTEKAPQWRTLEAHDADEQAHNLRNWQQQYDQFGAGRFYGRIQELALPDLHLFQEHTSHALIQRCIVQPGALWLGFAARQQECRINGKNVAANELMIRPGNCEFELITPDDFDIFGIVINQQALLKSARQQQLALTQEHLRFDKRQWDQQKLQALRQQVLHMLAPCRQSIHQQQPLLQSVLDLLVQAPPKDTDKPSFRRRKAAVETVQQYVKEHYNRAISISELCDLVHMSRRSLQYSFEDVIGNSPLQYLKNFRLNAARRQLINGLAEHQSIAAVAADHGFWHAAQFAADYKHLFGENPSSTVNRQR